MDDGDALVEPFARLLAAVSPPAAVRRAEREGLDPLLWSRIEESGYLDAMVPESDGGADLSLAASARLIELVGGHLVPAPVGDSMMARALLAGGGRTVPAGPIILVTCARDDAGGRRARDVTFGRVAEHALVDDGARLLLLRVDDADGSSSGVFGSFARDLLWSNAVIPQLEIDRPAQGLRPLAAVLRAVEMAGMIDAVLRLTVQYAGDRSQFGKSIARQQAVQQQLAVASEQVMLARMAAAMGCASGLAPTAQQAAIAKHCTSAAAAIVASIAHGVHGAMGISEEYDLQLYTRRLYEWRLAEGAESYWAEEMGRHRLASDAATSVDFMRQR